MKKIIALVCMITCIFGLTACSSEETYTDYEQWKIDYAEELTKEVVMPYMASFMDDSLAEYFSEYTAEEVASLVAYETSYITTSGVSLNVEGNAMKSAVISFNSAADAIGTIVTIGEPVGEIDDHTIIVKVPVIGTIKNAEAEIILSNDAFMVMESAALNEESTMGDLMAKAGMNTLIGMGTVFIVLILISFIISLFGLIPKMQAKMAEGKKKKEETKEESIDNTIAQIVEKEDVSDDLELVAVIAAAIAASEGAASTDGFVVRSIRKVNRRK